MDWQTLLAQGFAMLFLATGFVGYYARIWQCVASIKTDSHRNRCLRLVVPTLGFLIALIMTWTGFWPLLPTGGIVQQGFGLFIVSYIVLDPKTSNLEYALRGLALLALFVGTHRTLALWPNGVIILLCLLVWLVFVRLNGNNIRYHILPHVFVLLVLAIIYWSTATAASGAYPMNNTLRVQAVLLYAAACLATGIYLFTMLQADKKSAVNARKATYDALTNTKTYAIFQDDLEKQFALSVANNQALTMVEIDVDHFKQVNDHYGHLAGNEILIGVATTLRDVLRQHAGSPQLYRTGGEEFSLIFANQTADEVLPVIIDCWKTVHRTRYSAGNSELGVTISCGGTERRVTDQSADDLFKRVDDNLYQSKKRGRNVITMNGKTIRDESVRRAREIFAYYTQAMIDLDNHAEPIAHEIIIAQNMPDYDRWQNWSYGTPLISQLAFMDKAVKMAPNLRLAVNLSIEECVEPYTVRRLHDFMRDHPDLRGMMVEIQTPTDLTHLKQARDNMAAADIKIVLDVQSISVKISNVPNVLKLVDGIKLPLPAVRDVLNHQNTHVALDKWLKQCRDAGVDIIYTNLENSEDTCYARDVLHARFVQGFVFDRPDLPRID